MTSSDLEILEGCLKGNPKSQEALYYRYGSKMLAICMRYTRTTHEAEDLFHEAFVRVFEKINQYKGQGSFEGWMRRIFVTTAINYFQKNKKDLGLKEMDHTVEAISYKEESAIDRLSAEELTRLISQLPAGYRMVFNLFVIEGYNHPEIAEMLQISEGTSKSQLAKARAMLRCKISGKTLIEDAA
ncbi:RNA polymerase sigma factor [Umezakia ovalisporum]|uniref:RNA polymerase sigma factor n=1 Tax=Umezakia ovalisporum TaxID=75695 RepID=UPI0039C60C08